MTKEITTWVGSTVGGAPRPPSEIEGPSLGLEYLENQRSLSQGLFSNDKKWFKGIIFWLFPNLSGKRYKIDDQTLVSKVSWDVLKISIKLIIFQFLVFLIFILCIYALQTSYPAGHPPLSLRMPFFILIDFLPSVILEHSETTTRFFFFKRLDVLQNRSSTGENLLQRNFVDVYITRDSQRLPTLERVSTGYGWYEMVGSFDIWLIAIGDVCNTVALTRLPADRSRGAQRGGETWCRGGGWLGVRGGGKGEQFAFAIELLLSWLHLRCILDGHFI